MEEETQPEVQPEPTCCGKKCRVAKVIIAIVILALIALTAYGFVKYFQASSEVEELRMELNEAVEEIDELSAGNVEAEEETQTIEFVQGLQMDIPAEWEVLEITEDEVVIQTATDPYVITETITIAEHELDGSDFYVDQGEKVIIYGIACAPSMGCYRLDVDGQGYEMNWPIVESTEPAPENLDGVWFPEANFTTDDIIEILKTIR